MTPDLSVVVVTDEYETVDPVIRRLRDQSVRDRLELVIVVPADGKSTFGHAELDGFAAVQVVEVSSIHPMSSARSAGVRAARGRLIFLGETHSFPLSGFAATLVQAHKDRYDAVVPGLRNANPATPFSWASFLMDYGLWLDRLPAGEIAAGPTWNTAYARDFLLGIDALEVALSHGDYMAALLRARGGRVYFEPEARIDHANIARANPWIEQRFLAGRLVGASRKARWPFSRCLAYVACSPVIPVVILRRLSRPVRRLLSDHALPPGTLLWLVLGALARTAGEVVGYTRGAGPTAQPRMDEYELHKMKFVSPSH